MLLQKVIPQVFVRVVILVFSVGVAEMAVQVIPPQVPEQLIAVNIAHVAEFAQRVPPKRQKQMVKTKEF